MRSQSRSGSLEPSREFGGVAELRQSLSVPRTDLDVVVDPLDRAVVPASYLPKPRVNPVPQFDQFFNSGVPYPDDARQRNEGRGAVQERGIRPMELPVLGLGALLLPTPGVFQHRTHDVRTDKVREVADLLTPGDQDVCGVGYPCPHGRELLRTETCVRHRDRLGGEGEHRLLLGDKVGQRGS